MKHTKGPWERSTIEYQDDLFRVIRKESSHYADEDAFYVQDRVGIMTSTWWDVKQDEFNTPFYKLEDAINFAKSQKYGLFGVINEK